MRRSPVKQNGVGLIAILLIVLVIGGLVAAGSYIGYRVSQQLLAHMTLKEQPITVGLPETLSVTTIVENTIDIGLDGYISTSVPFAEDLQIPFVGQYDVDIEIDAQIPVQFEVVYEGVIPVDTMAEITAKTEIDFGNVKKLRNLEIETAIPMKFDLPVSLRVPVNDTIRFHYKGPIVVYADERLDVRLEDEFPVSLLVQQVVSTPIKSALELKAAIPQIPVKAEIRHANLDLRVSTLKLEY